ncbi:MAG: hypothetical protein ACREJC_22710 [Tepidisphaeraceae bacterium]
MPQAIDYQSGCPGAARFESARFWWLVLATIGCAVVVGAWANLGVSWAVEHERTAILKQTLRWGMYRWLFLDGPAMIGLLLPFGALGFAVIQFWQRK